MRAVYRALRVQVRVRRSARASRESTERVEFVGILAKSATLRAPPRHRRRNSLQDRSRVCCMPVDSPTGPNRTDRGPKQLPLTPKKRHDSDYLLCTVSYSVDS